MIFIPILDDDPRLEIYTKKEEKMLDRQDLTVPSMPARRWRSKRPLPLTTNKVVREIMSEIGTERIEEAVNSLREQAASLRRFEDRVLENIKEKAYIHDGLTVKFQYKGTRGAYLSWWDKDVQKWREIIEDELPLFLSRYLSQEETESYLLSRKARGELVLFVEYFEAFERAFGVI